jgi:hypothetical protein
MKLEQIETERLILDSIRESDKEDWCDLGTGEEKK